MILKNFKCRLFIGVLVVTMVVLGLQHLAFGEVAWRKYAGTNLRLVSWATPYSEVAQQLTPEFERKTGIKVNWEMYGAWQVREKTGIELTSRSPELDMFYYQSTQRALWLWKAGALEDITKFINDPTLTPPDWDWEDFYGRVRQTMAILPGMAYGVPTGGSTSMLYYRTDLLEEAGIPVPGTYDELEQSAAKLGRDTDGDGSLDIFGWVARGKGGQATYVLTTPLFAFGGAWQTIDREPAFDKPESLRAIEWYGRMLREYGPPDPLGIGWLEGAAVFETGKAAMHLGDSDFNARYNNPEISKVVGKWAASTMPAGPAGRFANVNINMIGISKYSKNKEAAWLYLQWLNNKENTAKLLQGGYPVVRASAWKHPDFKPAVVGESWAEVMRTAHQKGRDYCRPLVLGVGAVRAEIGGIIEAAINAEPLEPIAQKVVEKVKEITRKDGSNELPMDPERAYMPTTIWR